MVLSQSGAGKSGAHRGDRAAHAARGRRALHPAHPPEPLLHRARLPRPQARDRRGALRLGRGRLLDPRPAEPEEAHRRGAGEGPRRRGTCGPRSSRWRPGPPSSKPPRPAPVNHENATRCFELTMDESEEQTQRIHERQTLLRTERGLELRRKPKPSSAATGTPSASWSRCPWSSPTRTGSPSPRRWLRTRRDHARFLNLIEVSAFLHQYQRERKGRGHRGLGRRLRRRLRPGRPGPGGDPLRRQEAAPGGVRAHPRPFPERGRARSPGERSARRWACRTPR